MARLDMARAARRHGSHTKMVLLVLLVFVAVVGMLNLTPPGLHAELHARSAHAELRELTGEGAGAGVGSGGGLTPRLQRVMAGQAACLPQQPCRGRRPCWPAAAAPLPPRRSVGRPPAQRARSGCRKRWTWRRPTG